MRDNALSVRVPVATLRRGISAQGFKWRVDVMRRDDDSSYLDGIPARAESIQTLLVHPTGEVVSYYDETLQPHRPIDRVGNSFRCERAHFGRNWPLTAPGGLFHCRAVVLDGSISSWTPTFETGGREYALGPGARRRGFAPVTPIVREDLLGLHRDRAPNEIEAAESAVRGLEGFGIKKCGLVDIPGVRQRSPFPLTGPGRG